MVGNILNSSFFIVQQKISRQSYWSQSIRTLLTLCIGVAIAWGLLGTPAVQAQDKNVNYTLSDLKYRDFSNKDVSGTSFAGALMQGANFTNANLHGTIITKGSFFQANLRGADLSETFADRVIFDAANLTDTIFTDAILSSSTFIDAEIAGADFSGALLDRFQTSLMCKRAEGVNPVTGIATRESLGCRD